MVNLFWVGEPESSASERTDPGLVQFGHDSPVVADIPAPTHPPTLGPTQSGLALSMTALPGTDPILRLADPAAQTARAGDVLPMTRRELRERERAATLRTETPGAALPDDAPTSAPEVFNPEAVAPRIVESERVELAVVEATTIFSASAPGVAQDRVSAVVRDTAEGKRAGRKPRKVKASRKSRSSGAAGLRNTQRIYWPPIMQAAFTIAAARVKPQNSHTKPFKRRMLSKFLSVGAMTGAALMIVSTSVPANAFFSTEASMPLAKSASVAEEVQSGHPHPVPLNVATPTVSRDGYTATAFKEQVFARYGNRRYLYTPNPNGTIRWPFPIAVPISDDFGYRVSPCSGCSSNHNGLDMTPGNGAPIGVIADGVVIGAISDSWGFGQHVFVEHAINGQRVLSLYAHMQMGSIRVSEGDQLKAGDVVGLVGSTGASTGPHLHLEIHVNGVPVDPFVWLQANAY